MVEGQGLVIQRLRGTAQKLQIQGEELVRQLRGMINWRENGTSDEELSESITQARPEVRYWRDAFGSLMDSMDEVLQESDGSPPAIPQGITDRLWALDSDLYQLNVDVSRILESLGTEVKM